MHAYASEAADDRGVELKAARVRDAAFGTAPEITVVAYGPDSEDALARAYAIYTQAYGAFRLLRIELRPLGTPKSGWRALCIIELPRWSIRRASSAESRA